MHSRSELVEEFSEGLELLSEWGAKVNNPKAEFDKIDVNGGGQILFEEFCVWALKVKSYYLYQITNCIRSLMDNYYP